MTSGDDNRSKHGMATGFAMVGLACYLVCMTAKGWLYTSVSSSGLWSVCARQSCGIISWEVDSYVPARALFIVSGIFQGFKLFLTIAFCVTKKWTPLAIFFGIADTAAGLTMLAGTVSFTVEMVARVNQGLAVFGYAFYFGWFGWIFFFIAGIINLSAGCSRKSYEVV